MNTTSHPNTGSVQGAEAMSVADAAARRKKQLSAELARYMDLPAFTAKKIGKKRAETMKFRREIATKRARAAIRFFSMPENLARLTAQVAAKSGETDASASGEVA